jgi:type 1 glutamine amidotransferase
MKEDIMKNILVLCDDFWHPGEVIKRGLGSIKTGAYAFDFVCDAKDILYPEMLERYGAIVNCKGNVLTGANNAAWFEDGVTEVGVRELEAYVKGGHGFLSLHAGNSAKEGSAYGDFVGNFFVGHPPRCSINVEISGRHPVTRGVENFSIRDEHYNIKCHAAGAVELFRTKSETGGDQTGGYVREIGGGRLCVMTPGHILAVWEHPAYQRLILNALDWCTRAVA